MAPTNAFNYSGDLAEYEIEEFNGHYDRDHVDSSSFPKNKGGLPSLKSIFTSKKKEEGKGRNKAISMPEHAMSRQVENRNFLANSDVDPEVPARRFTVPANIYHSYSTYEKLLQSEKEEFEVRLLNVPESQSSEWDYDFKRKIGVGSFGAVYLAQDRNNRVPHAVKEIECTSTTLKRQAERERDHLFACSSPFIVSSVDFYHKDDARICLVMEYLGNENLLRHLVRYGKLSEKFAKFYTAQIILAIEYMHNVGVIHRDLKPENIMVTKDGYIKVSRHIKNASELVDLGLSKQAISTDSLAGTFGYKAPEILTGHKYSKAVDWWSLGIIIYEMLAGARCSPCQQLQCRNGEGEYVIQNSSKISFPAGFPKTAVRDLIYRLLQNNVSRRLGSNPTGSADVRMHPWFCDIDWISIYRKEVTPPPLPSLSTTPHHYNRKPKFHRIGRVCH